jgi:hypothetical protein
MKVFEFGIKTAAMFSDRQIDPSSPVVSHAHSIGIEIGKQALRYC